MTKVIYVRHGQTVWNIVGKYQGITDVELSEEGMEQAQLLAEFFPVEELAAIYSSDLIRARMTAEKIADEMGLTNQPLAELREINFGDWEGLTYPQIVEQYPKQMENFASRPDILEIPNGEDFPSVQQRGWKAMQELIAKHDGETIAVVAHGAILRTLLAEALHMDLRHIWSIRLFNTAVSIVDYSDDYRAVELINSVSHLSLGNFAKAWKRN